MVSLYVLVLATYNTNVSVPLTDFFDQLVRRVVAEGLRGYLDFGIRVPFEFVFVKHGEEGV